MLKLLLSALTAASLLFTTFNYPAKAAILNTLQPTLEAKLRSQGLASYYCCYFHGRTTANGERFNQNALTAAHKTLRFGTRVKVTNLNNGKSVIVRINDRGPFIAGRIIDLSLGAARVIGLDRSGVAPVSMQIL